MYSTPTLVLLVLGRATFCCNNSFKSFGVRIYLLCTLVRSDFSPFFQADLPLVGWSLWTAIFKQFHRFSIGLRSELWPGHCRTFTFLLFDYSYVALALCLGSLSWWKENFLPSFSFLVDWSRFFCSISLYFAQSILPSVLTRCPVPTKEKHPL